MACFAYADRRSAKRLPFPRRLSLPESGVKSLRYSILALTPNDWDSQWVNRQQLLSRIGVHHVVLYSTGGWFVWDRNSEEWSKAPLRARIRACDNVWVDESPRYLMRWPRFPLLDRAVM